MIKFKDFHLNDILLDEKSYGNILVYDILNKTLTVTKTLCITFYKIDGFNRVYDGTRCLVLFGGKNYDFIFNRIRYLIAVKGGITYVFSHNYTRIKVDSYDFLPLEKMLAFIILCYTVSQIIIKIEITTVILHS